MNEKKTSSVSLRVASKKKSCEEISDALGLVATKSGKKGESMGIRSNPERKRDESLWLYDLDLDERRPLEEHLDNIAKMLEQKINGIRAIKDSCDVELFCSYATENGQGGFIINQQLLSRLNTLGIDVVFDLYMQ